MINYEETYSSVMDAITFRYLINLSISKNLDMHLIDMATMYLYRIINTDIYMKVLYMKVLEGTKHLKAKPHNMYSIKLK